MLHESLLLGRKYPSGMFNNSYRYAHIQSTKLIKIWMKLYPLQEHIFLYNCTRFLQETLFHKSYFVLHSTNTHMYLNKHYTFRCMDYRSKYFHVLLMSLTLFEFRIGQSFLRRTFSMVCGSNSPSLLLVILRANILLTTNLFLSNISPV